MDSGTVIALITLVIVLISLASLLRGMSATERPAPPSAVLPADVAEDPPAPEASPLRTDRFARDQPAGRKREPYRRP